MATVAAEVGTREPRRARWRVPIVPWVRCARQACHTILAQRYEPWQGDPLWIRCRRCGAMNRIDGDGSHIVYQEGDD